jgi:Recombination endonuclease VII
VTPDGYKAYCNDCAAAYLREYRQREPERFQGYERTRLERHGEQRRAYDRERNARNEGASRGRFARKIRRKYGITLKDYDELVAAPCALCGRTKNVVLDHCHETGAIRGPLCRSCNAALGIFGDDPARLRAAADYIEIHRKEN